MSKPTFLKLQSAGNDFILVDDRRLFFPSFNRVLIASLCRRKLGIGADGLILLQLSEKADFRMRFFNSDGSEAASCGNGLRCLTRFLTHLGCPVQTIETGDRIVSVADFGDRVSVDLGPPRDLKLNIPTERGNVHFVDTGVPHVVRFVPDVSSVALDEEGAYFRYHPLFSPEGTNVNFAALDPSGALRMRTYERGVEGETLSCGTGACAAAFILQKLDPAFIAKEVLFPGGSLFVEEKEGRMILSGAVTTIFERSLENAPSADFFR